MTQLYTRIGSKNINRRIGLLAFENAQSLDITGPLEVFACADRWLQRNQVTQGSAYSFEIFASQVGPVNTMSGIQIVATQDIREIDFNIDTLLVAGGDGIEDIRHNHQLVFWLTSMATEVRRIASVCNGALLLAKAGLLDGRRATTHWSDSAQLAHEFPNVAVVPDCIYVRDGPIYTSAGVAAGMDLALALVEEDWGQEIALLVAQRLVLFLRRPGGQAQFSQHLMAESSSTAIRDIQRYILDHLNADLSVSGLAKYAAMSERNFARIFQREVGTSPGKFVDRCRVGAARTKLEQTTMSIKEIAHACGFSNPEGMRRAFHRYLSIDPSSYRKRFR